jgi:hypothetical protein
MPNGISRTPDRLGKNMLVIAILFGIALSWSVPGMLFYRWYCTKDNDFPGEPGVPTVDGYVGAAVAGWLTFLMGLFEPSY